MKVLGQDKETEKEKKFLVQGLGMRKMETEQWQTRQVQEQGLGPWIQGWEA